MRIADLELLFTISLLVTVSSIVFFAFQHSVVRCFEDQDIIHVEGTVDPVRDIDIINIELALADMAQVEKRLQKASKDKKATEAEKSGLAKLLKALEEGTENLEAF